MRSAPNVPATHETLPQPPLPALSGGSPPLWPGSPQAVSPCPGLPDALCVNEPVEVGERDTLSLCARPPAPSSSAGLPSFQGVRCSLRSAPPSLWDDLQSPLTQGKPSAG